MLYVYLCTCTICTCINKTLYGCKIPVSYIYICMYTKNIDPSVSHTVNLCKIFNFDFLDVQFVKGLWSCNFEDTVSYNLLMMLVGP